MISSLMEPAGGATDITELHQAAAQCNFSQSFSPSSVSAYAQAHPAKRLIMQIVENVGATREHPYGSRYFDELGKYLKGYKVSNPSASIPTPLLSLPAEFWRAQLSEKPKAKKRHHSERELTKAHNAFAFANHKFGDEATWIFITINLKYHQSDRDPARWRTSVIDSIESAYRGTVEPHAIFGFENPSGGGRGLHMHALLYCPPEHHKAFVDALDRIFSKKFNNPKPTHAESGHERHLDKLFDDHLPDLARAGISIGGKPSRRTCFQKFRALQELKHTGFDIDLPFYITRHRSGSLLGYECAMKKLRYLGKPANPEIRYTTDAGATFTLQQMSLEGGAKTGGCRLQAQASTLFKGSNLICTRNLDATIQAADPTFTPPNLPIAEWFVPNIADKKKGKGVIGLLMAAQLKDDQNNRETIAARADRIIGDTIEIKEPAVPSREAPADKHQGGDLLRELDRLLQPAAWTWLALWSPSNTHAIAALITNRRRFDLRSIKTLFYSTI